MNVCGDCNGEIRADECFCSGRTDERARIVRLLKEVMTVKRGPFTAQRKVKAVERLIEELSS